MNRRALFLVILCFMLWGFLALATASMVVHIQTHMREKRKLRDHLPQLMFVKALITESASPPNYSSIVDGVTVEAREHILVWPTATVWTRTSRGMWSKSPGLLDALPTSSYVHVTHGKLHAHKSFIMLPPRRLTPVWEYWMLAVPSGPGPYIFRYRNGKICMVDDDGDSKLS